LLFFWLNNIQLAKERVKIRVKEGGHNIPNDLIERRYLKGIKNLFDIYLEIVDGTLIFDNSYGKHELIAQKIENEDLMIFDLEKFKQLKQFYDKER
jgi:predicted ABC-type ATPase